MERFADSPMYFIPVKKDQVTLEEAIKTYLFNSQLISLQNGTMVLIAPTECKESSSVHAYLNALLEDKSHPIRQVIYLNVCQSMQNGGGPACLRLRITMTENELSGMHPQIILTPSLYDRLMAWIDHNYRDRLTASDLADPQLLHESRIALSELTQILRLGSIYSFQR